MRFLQVPNTAYPLVPRYEEAERDLLDALNKDAQDADALANIITCQLHLGKPVTRYSRYPLFTYWLLEVAAARIPGNKVLDHLTILVVAIVSCNNAIFQL